MTDKRIRSGGGLARLAVGVFGVIVVDGQTAQDQRPQAVEGGVEAGIAPFLGIGWVVEAGGRMEDGAAGRDGIAVGKFSAGDAIGDDGGDLCRQVLDMGAHDIARFGEDDEVGGEQLRLHLRLLPLDRDQPVEPAPQALRSRPVLGDDLGERYSDALEPAFGHRVAQCRLAGEVPVDRAVADAERPGDVDHGGLRRPEAGQRLFGGIEDAVGRQAAGVGHGAVWRPLSLSRCAIWAVA